MGKIGGRNKSQDRQKPAQWERARQRIMGGHLSSQALRKWSRHSGLRSLGIGVSFGGVRTTRPGSSHMALERYVAAAMAVESPTVSATGTSTCSQDKRFAPPLLPGAPSAEARPRAKQRTRNKDVVGNIMLCFERGLQLAFILPKQNDGK